MKNEEINKREFLLLSTFIGLLIIINLNIDFKFNYL